MSFQFGPLTYQPQPVPVYQVPIYHPPPQPSRPATTGELILIGAIVFFFFLIFAIAAIRGHPQPHPKIGFTNKMKKSVTAKSIGYPVPLELRNKYPFGNEMDPAVFSCGCDEPQYSN